MQLDTIHCGNCIDILRSFESGCIDLIVTSPPYFVNKEYEKSIPYEEYCSMMQSVFLEINRVLKPGCYAVINFGDYFNSGNRFYQADVPSCYPASINYFRWGVELARMDLQATRIWRKKFAKMGIPFVCNKHPRPIFDYEHVWTFRKKNGSDIEFVNDRKLSQRGVLGEEWESNAGIKSHCASFPIELPQWAIKTYSKNENDVVLDPFCGSGTTCLACKSLNRYFIGIEINEEYCVIARKKLNRKCIF